MRIMAVESSGPGCAAALLEDGALHGEWSLLSPRRAATWLLPAISGLLEAVGWTAQDIDLFAAGAGPGSFTGTRVGLSTVQGIAVGVGRPYMAVPSLAAMACGTAASKGPGLVVALRDARRASVYTARFCWQGSQLVRRSADVQMDFDQLCREVEGQDPYFVGDGVEPYAAQLAARFGPQALAPLLDRGPRAAAVGLWAYRQGRGDAAGGQMAFTPVYLGAPVSARHGS